MDECISYHLKEFLEANGLEERIIAVSQHPDLKGKSDRELTYYSICAEAILGEPSVLITSDYAFFNEFYGLKVMYSHSNWYGMFKYLKRILDYV